MIQFGWSIAVRGDRVVVGGIEDGVFHYGGNAGPGFVSVYTVGVDDDRIVAGAPFHSIGMNIRAGAACIFTRSGSTWTQSAILAASTPATDARFGTSVALAGDLVAIGAPRENGGASESGAVHIFRLESGTWTHRKRLTAPSASADDHFGSAVALDGTTLVVGCPLRENGAVDDAGALFLYDLADSDPAEWSLTATLVDPDPREDQQMGSAVSISGSLIAAGAPMHDIGSGSCPGVGTGSTRFGAVHLFRLDAGDWHHEQRVALTSPACHGIANFGWSVAVADGRLLAGALQEATQDNGIGHDAFLFERTGRGWVLLRRLVQSSGGTTPEERFGNAVAFVSPNHPVVGAPNVPHPVFGIDGHAYTFEIEIADCDGNGIDDCAEIAACAVADCNGNGIPDCCDIAAETSEDANGNGIPDECDALLDCGGSLADCTVNGMPDECERPGLFDVIFVLDESGSVVDGNPPTFDLQKDAVRAAICGLGALDAFAAIASLRAKRLPEHAQQTPMGAGVHATPLRACRWVPVIRRTSSGVCTRRIPGQVLRTSGDDGAPDALREKARPGSPTREGGLQGGASAPLRMRVQRATACTAQCPGASSSSLTRACTRARARSPARCRSRQAADLECPDHSILRQGARAQGGLRPPLQPPCAHEGGGGQPACEWWCLRASGRAEQVGLVKRSPPSAPAIRADWWSTARTSRNSTLPCAVSSSRTCSAAPACRRTSATTTPPGSGTATATASRTASSDTGTTPRT
ncbi:MAG: hypothetical protein KF817_13990 [Phycisphaeraceae bacterium]|nr:hypothetical protein [Phycisphaeraceae bacterium]